MNKTLFPFDWSKHEFRDEFAKTREAQGEVNWIDFTSNRLSVR